MSRSPTTPQATPTQCLFRGGDLGRGGGQGDGPFKVLSVGYSIFYLPPIFQSVSIHLTHRHQFKPNSLQDTKAYKLTKQSNLGGGTATKLRGKRQKTNISANFSPPPNVYHRSPPLSLMRSVDQENFINPEKLFCKSVKSVKKKRKCYIMHTVIKLL